MSETSIRAVDAFLKLPRFAIAGVSRNPRDFSRMLMRQLVERGYDVVPVHPEAPQIEGRACAKSVESVDPPVEGILFLTPPQVTEALVPGCLAVGVKHFWFYRATGKGAANERALALCAERGIEVVAGECPLMFLDTGWIHRFHGTIRQLTGTYPR